jgi:putative holliday junction resolvase
MKYLALDVGRKHTGVAYGDSDIGISLPQDTIEHESDKELAAEVNALVIERDIETLILGMPLMPSGEEGEEVEHVRHVADLIEELCPDCTQEFVDERHTDKSFLGARSEDKHAQAACALLSLILDKKK